MGPTNRYRCSTTQPTTVQGALHESSSKKRPKKRAPAQNFSACRQERDGETYHFTSSYHGEYVPRPAGPINCAALFYSGRAPCSAPLKYLDRGRGDVAQESDAPIVLEERARVCDGALFEGAAEPARRARQRLPAFQTTRGGPTFQAGRRANPQKSAVPSALGTILSTSASMPSSLLSFTSCLSASALTQRGVSCGGQMG